MIGAAVCETVGGSCRERTSVCSVASQVSRWSERYAEFGLEGIERDLPRGAPPEKVDVQRLMDLNG